MANLETSGPETRIVEDGGLDVFVPDVGASQVGDQGPNFPVEGRASRRPSTLGTAPELALGDFKALNKQQSRSIIDIPSPPPLRRRSALESAPSAGTVAPASPPSRGRGCQPPKGGKSLFRSPCFGGSAANRAQAPISLDQRAQIAQFPPSSRKLSSGTIQILSNISAPARAQRKGDSSRRQSVSAVAAEDNSDGRPAEYPAPSQLELPAPPPSESDLTPSIPSSPPSEPGADRTEALPPQIAEPPPPVPEQLPLESRPSQCRCSISNSPAETDANREGVSLGDTNSMNKASENDPGNSSGQSALNAALLNAQPRDIIEIVKRADSSSREQQPRQAQAGASPIRGLRPNSRQNAQGRPPFRPGRHVPHSPTMARTAGGGQPAPPRPVGVRFNRQQAVRPQPQTVRGFEFNNPQNLPTYENRVPSPPSADSGVARLFDAIIGRGEHLDQYERRQQQEQEEQQLGGSNRGYENMNPQIAPEPGNSVPSPPRTTAGVTRLVDAILGRGEHLDQYDWQQQPQEENLRTRSTPSPGGNFSQRQHWPPQTRPYQPNAIPGRSPNAPAGVASSSRTPRFRINRTRGDFSEASSRAPGTGSGPRSGPGPSSGSGSVPNEVEAGLDPEYNSDQDMDITTGQNVASQTTERSVTVAEERTDGQDMDMSPEASEEKQELSTSEEIGSQADDFTWRKKVVDKEAKGRPGAKVDFDYHRRRGYPDTTFNPRPGDIIIRARKRSGLRLTDFYYYDNENYLEQGDQILRAKFEYLPPMDTMYLWCRLYVCGADGTYIYLDSTSDIVEKFRIDADGTTFKNSATFT